MEGYISVANTDGAFTTLKSFDWYEECKQAESNSKFEVIWVPKNRYQEFNEEMSARHISFF